MSKRMEWRLTNYREQHLRVGGRIVGKIMHMPHGNRGWDCYCPSSPKTWVGYRVHPDDARQMVEKAMLRKGKR